jgi:3-dehydroquinate dehydratase/shikimate dehydrogenase
VRSIGAANTLTFGAAGVAAHNSDATAAAESLLAALAENEPAAGVTAGPRTALVLGAGGAARAVGFALRREGMDVTVAGRTLERARKIATEVGCKAIDWGHRFRFPYDCLVNATPVGMHPHVDETPYEKQHLKSYMVVFDTVYNPENTLLVKDAQSVGCRVVTGVDMFVRQASIQHRIWHGAEPPAGVMREALKRATASAKLPA